MGERVELKELFMIYDAPNHNNSFLQALCILYNTLKIKRPTVSKHLWTVERENSMLAGRNFKQNRIINYYLLIFNLAHFWFSLWPDMFPFLLKYN